LLVGFLPANAYFALRVVRMTMHVNKEQVNDAAKLMIHRLIARELGCDPTLIEKAKISLDRSAQHFDGYSFVREWSELLHLPPSNLRRRLTSRDEGMTRLRLSSPFVLADGIVTDQTLRRRIWRAAKRLAEKANANRQFADLPRMTA
jgi:hypothetical protein